LHLEAAFPYFAGFCGPVLNLSCRVSGCSGLRSTGGPAAREGGLDPEVLRSRDFQGAVEEPLRDPERRPSLHFGQGGEDRETHPGNALKQSAGSSLLCRTARIVRSFLAVFCVGVCEAQSFSSCLVSDMSLWVRVIKRRQQFVSSSCSGEDEQQLFQVSDL